VFSITFNFDFTVNIVSIFFSILVLGSIVFIVYKMYKKQTEKSSLWKIILVTYIGLFSFSFNWSVDNTLLKVSILPLGVWILYFALRGKAGRWQRYRPYAWLGFGANFLILISLLLSIGVHNLIYPKNKLNTYIATLDHATVIHTHPAAKDVLLNQEILLNNDKLQEQLKKMRGAPIQSDDWYQDIALNSDSNTKNERFPYLLTGATAKWGSGLQAAIFIENDGKGLLLATANKQYYYRSEQSFLEGVK